MPCDDDDDVGMPWEIDAERAVESIVADLEFDTDEAIVYGPHFAGRIALEDVDDLREYLEEAYDEAWYASVPFESGEAVFDSDASGTIEAIIEALTPRLNTVGWNLD